MSRLKCILVACLVTTPAYAADLWAEPPVVDYASEAGFDWSGFYAGVHGGYAWGNADISAATNAPPLASYSTDLGIEGPLVGGQVGFNAQSGVVVYGVEADLAWSGIGGADTVVPPAPPVAFDIESNLRWLGTVRGRLGFAADTTMVYGTAGVAVADAEYSWAAAPLGGSDSATHVGWAAGAGVEHAVTDSLSVKAEYLYVDLGTQTIAGSDADTDISLTAHTVKAGLNFHF